eukprot:858523-Rhodomonas_salina.2
MGMGAGQAGALAPDIAKAKPAMLAIFKLIDRVPAINAESEDGDKTTRIQGSIELKVGDARSAMIVVCTGTVCLRLLVGAGVGCAGRRVPVPDAENQHLLRHQHRDPARANGGAGRGVGEREEH